MTKNVLAFFSLRKSTTGHALALPSQQDVTETRYTTVNYKMKCETEGNDGKPGEEPLVFISPIATDAARESGQFDAVRDALIVVVS